MTWIGDWYRPSDINKSLTFTPEELMALYKEKDMDVQTMYTSLMGLIQRSLNTTGPALPQDSQVNFLHNRPRILKFYVN